MAENENFNELFELTMQKMQEEQNRYIYSLKDSTPETRKNWSVVDWVEALMWEKGLIFDKDFPADALTPELWKEILICGIGCEAQAVPKPDKVLAILTKEDFKSYSSFNTCLTLACDGEWLAPVLPLDEITQEDFDDLLVGDPENYSSEKEFLKLVGSRFPGKRPPDHLVWPHKGEISK